MNKMFRIKDWNLRQKIIFHVFVIGLIAACLLTLVFITGQRKRMNEINRQMSELAGSMIENNVIYEMKKGKAVNIHPALQKIVNSTRLISIRIVDPDGKILNSSRDEEIGGVISPEKQKMLKIGFQEGKSEDMYSLKPVSSTEAFLAIRNRDDCFECHSPEKKIIGILDFSLGASATAALLKKDQIKGVIIAVFSLLVLVFIIVRLSDRIINKPIANLKNTMKKVQEGHLDVRLKAAKNDEIGDLTRSFNVMLSDLKKANEKLDELHNREMEKAEHLASLGELAAGLAHEIKNPIAGIKGALEVIVSKTPVSDSKYEVFREMIRQIEKIHVIVRDLLDFARPREIEMNLIDPNLCAVNAIRLARTQTRDKEVDFRFEGLEEEKRVLLDADKIQGVLLNLLLNSIEAIEKKGTISIRVMKKRNNWLMFAINDDGKGIKKEHLSSIFAPFFTTKKTGTGLGLSICRRIIEAHGGRIRVESVEEKDTTFEVEIPVQEGNASE